MREPLAKQIQSHKGINVQLDGRFRNRLLDNPMVSDEATGDSSSLTANLRFQTDAQPPRLTGELGGARLALADLAPDVGADRASRRADRVLPDERFDVPTLSQMDADVNVDLQQLDFGTRVLAPVQDLKLHGRLVNSQLALSNLRSPVTVGGQFKAPEVGIETKGLLARAAGALAPPAALLAFIDMGNTDDPTPCAPQAANDILAAAPKKP